MDFNVTTHLITKHSTMTNKEILQSDLLDIIFENRNKDYGAYAIRKGYNTRLFTALGAGLLVILIFIIMTAAGKSKDKVVPVNKSKEGIVIKTILMPKEKIKVPETPKEAIKQKPVKKIATVKYTTPPKIKKDTEVKNAMVAVKELENKEIAEKTREGKEADKIVVPDKKLVEDPGTSTTAVTGPSQPAFVADERDPEFPGGQEALRKFLSGNLVTPGNLDDGEKKVVQVKFKVDKDGSVTTFEIITSGGSDFDREVVRVCRKMPRWTPAIQNGINVPVSYVLPVTFIGVEE
ncbi:MAG: TonB family protein [Ferruginibacter sp.]|nr:TonB family protein [Chitinophagaceae bacterium]